VFESTKGRFLGIPGSDRDTDIFAVDDVDISGGHCPGQSSDFLICFIFIVIFMMIWNNSFKWITMIQLK
jgi:hypothetical protein